MARWPRPNWIQSPSPHPEGSSRRRRRARSWAFAARALHNGDDLARRSRDDVRKTKVSHSQTIRWRKTKVPNTKITKISYDNNHVSSVRRVLTASLTSWTMVTWIKLLSESNDNNDDDERQQRHRRA